MFPFVDFHVVLVTAHVYVISLPVWAWTAVTGKTGTQGDPSPLRL